MDTDYQITFDITTDEPAAPPTTPATSTPAAVPAPDARPSAGRRLVALEGGPKDKYWYWLSDWHIQQESARAQHLRPDQPTPRSCVTSPPAGTSTTPTRNTAPAVDRH